MINESIRNKYFDLQFLPYTYSDFNRNKIFSIIKKWMEKEGVSLRCSMAELRKLPEKVLKEQCLIAPGHDPEKPYHDSELCYLNVANIEELTNDDIKELISDYEKRLPEPENSSQEIWECYFPIWSGSRKHLKAKMVFETGTIVNGTWFIRPDGSKKRVSARGFEKIRRLAEEDGGLVAAKKYSDFPQINLGGDINGTLILAGGSGSKEDFFLEKVDNKRKAYVVEGYDVEPGDATKIVAEYQNWIKIYSDEGLLMEFRADRILVWSGMSLVIQLIHEAVNTKLYKNVDICDLESILEKGILSLDECGNNNWEDNKRADNPTNLVYLFKPKKGKANVYPNYGVALVETDITDVQKNEFAKYDVHKDDYIEYTAAKVEPGQITRILIPKIFEKRLHLPASVEKKVEWCGITAEIYGSHKDGLEPASDEILKRFAITAEIEKCTCFHFLRGKTDDNHMINLYNINYIF